MFLCLTIFFSPLPAKVFFFFFFLLLLTTASIFPGLSENANGREKIISGALPIIEVVHDWSCRVVLTE